MPLWGTRHFPSGNQKPVWANTANVSMINVQNATVLSSNSVEPGWIELTVGQGYVRALSLNTGGANINSAAFTAAAGTITFTGGLGPNANQAAKARFGINNVSNTVNSITFDTPTNTGFGYTSTPTLSIAGVAAADQPSIIALMGGRVGRNNYETLVSLKSGVWR